MPQKHSLYGKISFVALIVGLVIFIFKLADLSISKYSFYDRIPLLDTLSSCMGVVLIASLGISFLAGLVSMFQKNTNKMLPTISLSVTIAYIFLILLMLVQQATYIYHIEEGIITNYGVFEIPSKKVDSTKTIRLYEERILKANTDEIPASIGTTFGFNYFIRGEPKGESIEIMKITKYPIPGLQRNNKFILSDTIYFSVTLNTLKYSGFSFNRDYELVPGKWEIQMWYKGNKLLFKIFNVTI
jgi:hypothetical protein